MLDAVLLALSALPVLPGLVLLVVLVVPGVCAHTSKEPVALVAIA